MGLGSWGACAQLLWVGRCDKAAAHSAAEELPGLAGGAGSTLPVSREGA